MNPTTTIDTILTDEKKSEKFTIYPLTIGRQALMELVNSPYVFSHVEFSLINLIPSFYIMLISKEELRRYNSKNADDLISNAINFFDDEKFTSDDLKCISDSILNDLGILNKVSPNDTSEKPAPLSETDGSQM